MDSYSMSLSILMFPWLAHGHIIPYLELAKRILKKKNFHIYLCTTAINFSSINHFIQGNMLGKSMELIELHLHSPPELPPHYHTTKNLPSHLKFTLIQAFQTAQSTFSDIISALTPDLIIYDIFQPWVAILASSLGIPAVHFAPFGASIVSFLCTSPFPELYLKDHDKKSCDDFLEFLQAHVFNQDKDVFLVNFKSTCEMYLLKASRCLEEKYINYLSSSTSLKRTQPVGPLITTDSDDNEEGWEILQWLSKKSPRSTVYISFGSEIFLTKEEIEEMAKGLELSGVSFTWGIRSPPEEKAEFMDEAFPGGFLERVADKGLVVQGWTPQAKILGHPSTGAFICHGGWSSVNESIYYGVPMIVMPMILDHFMTAGMLADAGACVEIRREGQHDVVKGEEIAKAIEKVVVEESSAQGFRYRVGELSVATWFQV